MKGKNKEFVFFILRKFEENLKKIKFRSNVIRNVNKVYERFKESLKEILGSCKRDFQKIPKKFMENVGGRSRNNPILSISYFYWYVVCRGVLEV